MSPTDGDATPTRELLRRFRSVRARTRDLSRPLSPEDCQVQSMPSASPVKWHLAHTTWFFETFVLGRDPSYRPFRAEFRHLFNSYYVAIGPAWSRPHRGLLTRPSLAEVLEYRGHVDAKIEEALAADRLGGDALERLELGLHHEQQHQELLLTDVKHLLAQNPTSPVYAARSSGVDVSAAESASVNGSAARSVPSVARVRFEAGQVEVGHDGVGFAFDNEGPRHPVTLGAFELASRPVTNRDWLEFVRADGYGRPEWWLSDGFECARAQGWRAPLYWSEHEGSWSEFTLAGRLALELDAPVAHVSWYEADAFARFAGARLPTEFEWERAAASVPLEGRFADDGVLHPRPADPAGSPLVQMFGDVWEWTASDYAPYPRFRPWSGEIGEYNGKFMSGQRVLRGGSCATPRGHVRATYRNFFPPDARWQFSGVRLAFDA